MNSSTPVEHIPYDTMVGIWVGSAVSFSPTGEQVSSGQSRNLIYWHKRPTPDDPEGLLHFRQDQGQEGQIGVPGGLQGMIFSEYDLTVTGKHAESVTPSLTLIGVETRPDVYHFDGTEKPSGFRWYNSHHFTSDNERHIMGPVVNPAGKIGLILVQIFTRVSYEVEERYHRAL